MVVSDESAFLQLEKRNVAPSLITKIFLEKELRKTNRILNESFDYIDWLFENNLAVAEDALDSGSGSGAWADQLKLADERIRLAMGTQKWRRFFLTASTIRNFLDLNQSNYRDIWSPNREYNRLEYNVSSMDFMHESREFESDFDILLPLSAKAISEQCPVRFYARSARKMKRKKAMKLERQGQMNATPMAMDMVVLEEEGLNAFEVNNTIYKEAEIMEGSRKVSLAEYIPEEPDDNTETHQSETRIDQDFDSEDKSEDIDTIFYSQIGRGNQKNVEFKLPSHISKFRISVFAVSKEGVYGYRTHFVESQKPFSVQIDVPAYVYSFEQLELEVSFYNNQNRPSKISSDILNEKLSMSANSLHRMKIPIKATDLPRKLRFQDEHGNEEIIKIAPEIRHGIQVDWVSTYLSISHQTNPKSRAARAPQYTKESLCVFHRI